MEDPVWKWTTLLIGLMLAGTIFACGPKDGERKPEVAYWDTGPPPVLRFEGEKVFWKGEWVNDGPVTYYDKTGRVIGKGSFKLGLEDGPWTLEEGGHIAEGHFRAGHRDGPWVYRYASDQIQEEGSYRAGKRHGEW